MFVGGGEKRVREGVCKGAYVCGGESEGGKECVGEER